MKFLIIVSLLLFPFISSVQAQEEVVPDYTKFPENTYWVNVEYKLAPGTFKDKLLVVLFWDMQDPIGKVYCEKLEELNKKAQHMQLVSIVQGDADHPVVLSDLKAFVQDNGFNHPFGIAGDMAPFADAKSESLPKVFVFQKDVSDPTIYNFDQDSSFDDLFAFLEKVLYSREFTKDYSYWQMKPSPAPNEYAMPIIAYPSLLASNPNNNSIFIYENSQHRITNYTPTGHLGNIIAGHSGNKNDALAAAKIGIVTGMEFDLKNDVLCFVDFSARKIKAADISSDIVYDVPLNDNYNAINFPVDVAFMDTSMYVLNILPAQVVRVGMKARCVISAVSLESLLTINERVVKICAGKKLLYIVTTHGRVLSIANGKVDVFYTPENWESVVTDLVETKAGVNLLMPRKHQVALMHKKSMRVVYSTPMTDSNIFDDVQEDIMKLPSSLCVLGKNIYLSDQGNNLIRVINLSKKKSKRFDPEFSEQMAMSEDAIAVGEQVYFEQEIFGEGTNEVEFVFELQGMKLLPNGRSEFAFEESSGIELVSATLTEKGAQLRISTKEETGFVQMELYLTLYDPAYPQVVYYKSAVLNIEYQVIPNEEKSHKIYYRPNIKAY
jgi:hypothetical protein